MSQLAHWKPSCLMVGLLGLTAFSPVHAFPAQPAPTAHKAQSAPAIEPRDPRLIPDTEAYLSDIFNLLGVSLSSSSTTEMVAIATPTISIPTTTVPPVSITDSTTDSDTDGSRVQAKPNQPTDAQPTMIINGVGVITPANIQQGQDKPFENIQIGPGYQGGKKLAVSDLPVIFAAVESEVAARLQKTLDSSDQIGLKDPFGL
ncbi:hypothetical protein PDE_07147 [Penicillium oxalicum 114-2]|uniref:Uncharacterized protein n=2 Tax=Penicillium oxalicum TaxID=69781 RepID=S8BBE0_PENO1|nr:hypothetical protein PDE_07147 [Penicillium oxalicum 114-2]